MSTELMPADNPDAFVAAEYHPMGPEGYSPFPSIDRVGRQLQGFREGASLTQKYVADELEWSPSKVIRIENGQVRPDVSDIKALLGLLGVADQTIVDPLIDTVRKNRRARTSTPFTPILSVARQHYMGYEAVSERVGYYAPIGMPDIFLTAHYAAEFDAIMFPRRTTEQHELAARLRRERAGFLLGKHGPPLQVVINEGVLYRPERGPSPSGERDQYAELRTVIRGLQAFNTAGRHHVNTELNPNISIQIARFSSGSYFATAHARTLLWMANQPHPALYTDLFEESTSFDAGLQRPTRDKHTFEALVNDLPGPEHTNVVLDYILGALPASIVLPPPL